MYWRIMCLVFFLNVLVILLENKKEKDEIFLYVGFCFGFIKCVNLRNVVIFWKEVLLFLFYKDNEVEKD